MVVERFPADGGYNATPADPDAHMAEVAREGWMLINASVCESKDVSGTEVRWYRPPYGLMTAEGLYAAQKAHLQTNTNPKRNCSSSRCRRYQRGSWL